LKEDANIIRDQFFADREKYLSDAISVKRKKSNIFSNVRMLFFLSAIVTGGTLQYYKQTTLAVILFLLLMAMFIVLVLLHTRQKNQITLLEMLQTIQEEYRARTEHRFDVLQDPGEDFRDPNHDFSDDLDLFGRQSLFHLISISQTWFGRKCLADFLLSAQNIDKSADDIYARQTAVKEFSSNIAMLQDFQAAGRLSRKSTQDPRRLLEYASHQEGQTPVIPLFIRVLSICLTLFLGISSFLAYVLTWIPDFVPLIIILLQLIVMAAYYQKCKPVFASVEDLYSELSAYSDLFKSIENASVSSEILVQIQKSLQGNSGKKYSSASDKVRILHRICLFIQARSQPILFFLLNSLCLYDIHCVYFLEKWKRISGSQLESYMKGLGTWEALMSLSTLSVIYPECSFPVFVSEKRSKNRTEAHYSSHNMGHPLIPIIRQVRNDISLQNGIAIITGSNMSGKTTLLRTVGINAVLAYAGAICCADSTNLGMMQIGASMRIADNLGEGLSTFYAELLRIEKIIQKARAGNPLLFLIDEIFRGTNSRDRTDGAVIVLTNLSKPWIIGLMSTHDYELCSLDSKTDLDLHYYHFSESYDDEGIHFDYHLTPGVSMSANARYLMRMIGLE
jgi:Flp pilus assembly protein TadB